jgi:hypothetical protein
LHYKVVCEVSSPCFSVPLRVSFTTLTKDCDQNADRARGVALAVASREGLRFDPANSTVTTVSIKTTDNKVQGNSGGRGASYQARSRTSCALCGYVYEGRAPRVCRECKASTADGTLPQYIDFGVRD